MAAIILFFYEDVLKKYLGDGIMRAMLVFYGPRILYITTGSVRKRWKKTLGHEIEKQRR